jgi:hypothetical protein
LRNAQEFDVAISLSYVQGHAGDCAFSWREKTNKVPPFLQELGAKEDEWYDAFSLRPQSDLFKPWHNRKEPCPCEETATIHDAPIYGHGRGRRTLYLAISISSAAGEPYT